MPSQESGVALPAHALVSTIAPTSLGELPPDLLEETGFRARYAVGAALGEGGMGVVQACVDRRIGREVAVKSVRPGSGSRSDLVARFLREACVQGQLEHPSVVPVHDLGRNEDGTLYFTMKRVRGVTFERVVEALRAGDADAERQFSRRKLLTAFASVCHAVDFAHARGVVHRDLKPANVMLGDFGEVYVLDWGLAKVLDAPEPRTPAGAPPIASGSDPGARTVEGATMGTPGYMSPEQARSEPADTRSDVYALGAMLFELLALEPLHPNGGPVEEALDSTLRGADARPSARAPQRDVPPELDAVCVRATALDPSDRFPGARALVDAVERYLDGDRDLELRRTLARDHARAAGELAHRALADDREATLARSRALQEVGRAIALDPGNTDALRTLVQLLTEPPRAMPDEAKATLGAERRRQMRVGGRIAALAYLAWFAYVPLMVWMGVRSWASFLLASAAWAGAALLGLRASSAPGDPNKAQLPFVAAGAVAAAATSTMFGPYVLVPTIATVSAMLLLMAPDRSRRVTIVALCCLAVVVPAALQGLGMVPSSYAFGRDAITIAPRMIGYPPVATHVFLLVTSIVILVASSVMVARFRDTLSGAEERVHVQAWQLRQLVPEPVRAAGAPAPPESAARVAEG